MKLTPQGRMGDMEDRGTISWPLKSVFERLNV